MTLLSRLARLFRAKLYGSYSDRPASAEREFWQEAAAEAQTAQANRPGYDPVLARYYANLELPYGADLITVRQAWKNLLRKYHPDLHSHDPEKRRVATELTQGLNRAYEELEKRLTPQ